MQPWRHLIAALALATVPTIAIAQTDSVLWVDWTGVTAGAVQGDLGGMAVTFTGRYASAITGSGTDYWQPDEAYLSESVTNGPPASDIIRFVGGTTDTLTITFSEPVTDPVLAICSLGSSSQPRPLIFDNRVEILSFGRGYWGNGSLAQIDEFTVVGQEGHGVVRFPGTHQSISWQNPEYESWSGITIGIPIVTPTAVGDLLSPASLSLRCAPSPFRPTTTITYEIEAAAVVRLVIFDVSGRAVRRLEEGRVREAGRHTAVWNGRDDGGRQVASGVYFCRLEAGSRSGTVRMVRVE